MSDKPFLSDFQLTNWILTPPPGFWRTSSSEYTYKKMDNYKGALMRMIDTWLILVEFWDNSVLPENIVSDRTFRDILLRFFQSGWVVHKVSSEITNLLSISGLSGMISMEYPLRPVIHLPNQWITREVKINHENDSTIPGYHDFLKEVGNSLKTV